MAMFTYIMLVILTAGCSTMIDSKALTCKEKGRPTAVFTLWGKNCTILFFVDNNFVKTF